MIKIANLLPKPQLFINANSKAPAISSGISPPPSASISFILLHISSIFNLKSISIYSSPNSKSQKSLYPINPV